MTEMMFGAIVALLGVFVGGGLVMAVFDRFREED